MKTFSVYVIVAALALMEVNAVALPSDESDFHRVQDTELGPVYSNSPPKERRDDTTWYPIGGDGGSLVYSNVEPSHVSKRDRHHGGPPQSGPGGHGKGPGWVGGNHHHDINPDTNPSATTTGTAPTGATDTENTKRDQHHRGPPQSGPGGHGKGPGWVGGNHHHDTNPDTNPSATTTGTAPTGATDTENTKRDQHHRGPPQSGPGGHGKGPGWVGGNHHHDTNPDTNPSATTTGTAPTGATDTENTKRDQHHGGPPQFGHGGHGNRPGWVGGNHHHGNNPDTSNPNTDPSATTTSTAPAATTGTKNTKRDDAYKPAPASYVEAWVKKHPTEKRDLVERGTIEKRTYAQCVACVAACHLLQAGIYTLSISQQVHFCLGYCATLGSCTPYFQAKYQDQYGPQFPS